MVSTKFHGKMAAQSLVQEVVNEEKLVNSWPDQPSFYGMRSKDSKRRDKMEKVVADLAQQLEKNMDLKSHKFRCFEIGFSTFTLAYLLLLCSWAVL